RYCSAERRRSLSLWRQPASTSCSGHTPICGSPRLRLKSAFRLRRSTMSNDGMDRVARVPGLRYWWQLYVFGPPGVRETLIERARNAGCEALIVTVDAQIYGNREWHKRTTAGPKSLSWRSKFDALMHPRWFARGILTHGMPRFENVIEFVPKDRRGFFDSAHWIRSQMDRKLSWDTIARIRERL